MTDDSDDLPDGTFAQFLAQYHESLYNGVETDCSSLPPEWSEHFPGLRRCMERLEFDRRQKADGGALAPSGAFPAQVLLAAAHNQQLGRFHIVHEIGSGAHGVVYLAHDPLLRRDVALKVPRLESVLKPELRQRFLREARAAAGLNHPNIAALYEAGEETGLCYLASAYCPGPTLAAWLRTQQSPMPARAAAELVATLAEAVQHAHSHGVLHRDLKPANILLEPVRGQEDGNSPLTPKIVDFGLAKLTEGNEEATRTGMILGSVGYMAPEQARGETSEIGPATDVYALGAILYELLTRQVPFPGQQGFDTFQRIIEEEPAPPTLLRSGLSRDLETICLKCLRKGAGQRYASAHALADDLRSWLSGKPIAARPPRTWERLAKWARRRPTLAALVVVSTLALLALIVGGAHFNHQLSIALRSSNELRQQGLQREAALRRLLYVADMRAARQAWEHGHIPRALEILNRCVPGSADEEDLRSWEWHYLRNCCRGEKLSLRGHAAPILSMSVAPGDRLLATADKAGVIKIWELPNGHEVTRLQYASQEVNTVAFSPDGHILATAGQDRRVHLWDTADWTERRQLLGHTATVTSLHFSPDGSMLATGARDATVRVWSVVDGRLLRSWEEAATVLCVQWSPDGHTLASCSDDKTVKLWDAATGRERGRFGSRTLKDICMRFAPDGTWLAAGGYDNSMHLWDLANRSLAGMSATQSNVWSLDVDPVGRLLAAGEGSASLSLWHVGGRRGDVRLLRRLVAHDEALRGVVFAEKGQTLLSAAEDGTIKSWDVPIIAGRSCYAVPHTIVDLALNHRLALVCTAKDEPVLWDLERGRCLRAVAGSAKPTSFGDFSVPANLVAVVAANKEVCVSDIQTGELRARLPAAPAGSGRVAFSPDGAWIARTTDESAVELWNPRTGAAGAVLKAPEGYPMATVFSPNGRTLAISYEDGVVRLWDCATATCHTTLHHGGEWVIALAFSADGSLLATGGANLIIKVWDVASGRLQTTLAGHSARIYGLAFSPDGRTLVSTSKDCTARVWNLLTSTELFTLAQGATGIRFPSFTAEGELAFVTQPDPQGVAEVMVFDGRKEH